MKRLATLAFALVLAVGLSACSGEERRLLSTGVTFPDLPGYYKWVDQEEISVEYNSSDASLGVMVLPAEAKELEPFTARDQGAADSLNAYIGEALGISSAGEFTVVAEREVYAIRTEVEGEAMTIYLLPTEDEHIVVVYGMGVADFSEELETLVAAL